MTFQEMLNYIINQTTYGESPLFDALIRAIGKLSDFDEIEQEIANRTFHGSNLGYRKSLSNVLYACDIYLGDKVHKTPYDDPEKLAFAKKVKETLQPLHQAALMRERQEINTMQEYARQNPALPNDEDLWMMGQLQKNIGGSRIVARKRQITAKQSKGYSFFRNIAHKVFTGLKAIGLAVSSLVYVAVAPFTSNREKYIKQIDLSKPADVERIPGTKSETFDSNRVSAEVAQGPNDQPILADKRRVPFVFEKPIPEDPDQPPTFALRFKQSMLGSSIGFSRSKDPGHGFVSMKYSKINPLTGKMQRYETVFGFYPKAGFGDGTTLIAQSDEGLVVPGQVKDDNEHAYSIEKVYTVDNKTINKVALAAQKYETEGYNMLSRNCASFAHDMAETAGIDTSMFMQKTDLRSYIVPVYDVGLILAGTMLSDVGEYSMLKDGVKTDYSYNNFGNQKLTPQVVRKLSKKEFNFRNEGYVPSRIAEVIRDDDTVLLSENEYKRENKTAADLFNLLEHDIERMHLKLDQYADKHSLPELKENNQRLSDFMKTRFRLMFKEALPALKDYYTAGNETVIMRYKDQKEACRQLTGTINEYLKELTEIYRDTYKNDPDLNLLFNGYASKLNALKNVVKERYLNLRENLEYPQDDSPINDVYKQQYLMSIGPEDYAEEIDINRDDAPAIKSFLFGRVPYKYQYTDKDGQPKASECQLPTFEYIGRLKIFGSMDDVMRDMYLRGKDANSLTGAEKKELEKYNEMRSGLNEFIEAAKSFVERPAATKEEIVFAFSELPELEEPFTNDPGSQVRFQGKKKERPSAFCQGIIFGKTLQGLRERISNISPQACEENSNVVAETVGAFLNEKIADDTFHDIIDVLIENEKKEFLWDKRTDSKETYERNLKNRVCSAFQASLFDTYVNPLLEEVKGNIGFGIKDNALYKPIKNAFDKACDELQNGSCKQFNDLLARKFGVHTELLKKKTECKGEMKEALLKLSELKSTSADTREAFETLKRCTAKVLAVNELLHTSGNVPVNATNENIDRKADFYKKSDALSNETVESIAKILQEEPQDPDNIASAAEIGLVNTFKAYEAAKNRGAARNRKNAEKVEHFFNALKENKQENANQNREEKGEVQNEQERQVSNVINIGS